eukprot:12641696-Alexandrium_andersonii.AAC.1
MPAAPGQVPATRLAEAQGSTQQPPQPGPGQQQHQQQHQRRYFREGCRPLRAHDYERCVDEGLAEVNDQSYGGVVFGDENM